MIDPSSAIQPPDTIAQPTHDVVQRWEPALFFVRVFRILWKELFEYRSRPIVLCVIVALSIGATLAAGNLYIRQPTIRIALYQPEPNSEISPDVDAAKDILQQYTNVVVIRMPGSFLDLTAMQRDDAQYAVVPRGNNWVVFYNFRTLQQEEQSAWLVNLLSTSLNVQKPLIAGSTPSEVKKIGLSSRTAALPGSSAVLLIPRTISLTVLFLPFVLSARSFSREVSFGTLSTILATRSGGWAPILVAKAIASSWISLIVLMLLILTIRPIFSIAPKPGLMVQLGAQSLAILASATLGLLAAVWSRNQSQIYIYVSIYFLVLVLLSGFLFPLETASLMIRIASNVSPLTYSQKILENWLFFGTDARIFSSNIVLLAEQLAVAVFALIVAAWVARRRV